MRIKMLQTVPLHQPCACMTPKDKTSVAIHHAGLSSLPSDGCRCACQMEDRDASASLEDIPFSRALGAAVEGIRVSRLRP